MLTAKDTTSRKPIDSTMAKENRRSLMYQRIIFMPLTVGVGTSQMVFSASRSSIITPEAPNISVSTPMSVATIP